LRTAGISNFGHWYLFAACALKTVVIWNLLFGAFACVGNRDLGNDEVIYEMPD